MGTDGERTFSETDSSRAWELFVSSAYDPRKFEAMLHRGLANFEEDLDISAPKIVGRCLESAGQEAVTILEEAQSPASKQGLRERTDQAVQLGIFGAPFFVVDRELFWGNDRLESALEWCAERAA